MIKRLISFVLSITLVFSQKCTLEVPDDPLNTGLFKPWFLGTDTDSPDNCTQINVGTSVFVESTILDINTGKLFVYNPLVIDKGDVPAASPLVGNLPVSYVAIINIGSNGESVRLVTNPISNFYTYSNFKDSLEHGNCVNGFQNSIFGQVVYCNAINFFAKVNELIASNLIKVPPILNSTLGDTCPTTRSFAIVDQDQSDNINTQYIITTDMKIAQDYPINNQNLNVSMRITNPSDNRLITDFVNKAIGCDSFTGCDLVDNAIKRNSLALNEIHANQLDPNDIKTALTPSIDPMCLIDGNESLEKTNVYRNGVNQPLLLALNNQSNINYCNQLEKVSIDFYILHKMELENFVPPDRNVATNLLNFLINRYINTWNILNCLNLTGRNSLLQVILNDNGVVISNNLATVSAKCCKRVLRKIPCTSVKPTSTTGIVPTETQVNTTTGVVPTETQVNTTTVIIPTETQVNTTTAIIPTETQLTTTGVVSTEIQVTTTTGVVSTETQVTTTTGVVPTETTTSSSDNTNFCGTSFHTIDCKKPCLSGLDNDCFMEEFCFKVPNYCNNTENLDKEVFNSSNKIYLSLLLLSNVFVAILFV